MGPQSIADDDIDCLERHYGTPAMKSDEDGETRVVNLLQEFERRREKCPAQQLSGWKALLFAQLVALVATSMNATSYVLEYGMHRFFPMFLLFNSYVILSFHLLWSNQSAKKKVKRNLSPESVCGAEEEEPRYRLPIVGIPLRTPWYSYLCLSCLDIVPNYLALMAVSKTSFTSATLLQSLTIPSTMIFCRLLLGKEYRQMHYVGVLLCMMGGIVTVLTDIGGTSSTSGEISHPHSYSGDILAVLAAVGYGVGDACAEFWSKYVNRQEYLGMLGLFGAFWTFLASVLCERDAVLGVLTSDKGILLQTMGVILWYIASLAGYYIIESVFLMKSDATLLNLSVQTQNFWAILFSVAVFRETPGLPFYVAISLVVSGVFVYELFGNSETARQSESSSNNDSSVLTESTPLNRIDQACRLIGIP